MMSPMSRLRSRLPEGALDRVRLGTILLAVVNAVLLLPLVDPRLSAVQRAAAVGAVVLITAISVITYARGKVSWWEPLAIGPLVLVFGTYVSSTVGLIGLGVGATVSQSLYGSGRAALNRTLGTLAGTAAALFIPAEVVDRIPAAGNPPAAVVLAVPVVFAGFMRLVGVALLLLEQAGAREALLARTGIQLSELRQVPAVRAVLQGAGRDLCALTPGMALVVIRAESGQGVIEVAYGLPGDTVGALPMTFLDGIDPHDLNSVRRLREVADLETIVGHRRSGWFALGLGTQDAARYILAATAARNVPLAVLDTLRTLTTQCALAEANCHAHAELTFLAHHDQLTTTLNRRAFFALLAAAVDAAQCTDTGQLALLTIDLDDFKQVNDTMGHHAGDEVLIAIAERLASVAGERGVASRFGGDEFAVLLSGLDTQGEADEIADRICRRLQEPVQLATGFATVGASVGLVGITPGATAGDVMRFADIAMYSAKSLGKNRVERFDEQRHGKAAQIRLMDDHLAHIVTRDEMVLHYQPVVNLKTRQCIAVEVLARWQHPTLGLLMPSEFMPIAEKNGVMSDLAAHVLSLACRQLKSWSETERRVCVSVSSRLLLTPGLGQIIRTVLAETGVCPAQLCLEFSESEVLNQEVSRSQLTAIAAIGVRIALDGTGTGALSLTDLFTLPLDQLEIDGNLFGAVGGNPGTEMIELTMSVSGHLGLETVAKRVDTAGQLDGAVRAGLTMVQGNYVCPPMPADGLAQWLAGTTPLPEDNAQVPVSAS